MLYEDLKADSIMLDSFKSLNQNNIQAIDTLIFLLKAKDKSSLPELYYYGRRSTRKAPLIFNQRTFIQQQNNGGQWFIENAELSTKVISYYDRLTIFRNNNSNVFPEILNMHPFLAKIFDASVFWPPRGAQKSTDKPTVMACFGAASVSPRAMAMSTWTVLLKRYAAPRFAVTTLPPCELEAI